MNIGIKYRKNLLKLGSWKLLWLRKRSHGIRESLVAKKEIEELRELLNVNQRVKI